MASLTTWLLCCCFSLSLRILLRCPPIQQTSCATLSERCLGSLTVRHLLCFLFTLSLLTTHLDCSGPSLRASLSLSQQSHGCPLPIYLLLSFSLALFSLPIALLLFSSIYADY
ncbi:hypothetical protein BDV19DRAFT_211017 [Aspergillus venezuelensis]